MGEIKLGDQEGCEVFVGYLKVIEMKWCREIIFLNIEKFSLVNDKFF